jgi:hypothetical protein
MLSGDVLSSKTKLEGCILQQNFSNNTPQLGESPQSNGEVISSPRSPDYPPRVSVSPHPCSPDTTFPISMMSVNSTVIMDTAKYNEENTDNAATCLDKVTENLFCPKSPKKINDSQVGITKISSEQQDTTEQENIASRELIAELIEVKKESVDSQEELQMIKSEWIEDGFSAVESDRVELATASQEKSVDSVANPSSSSHSKTYSSSREKRSKEDRRYCSRCHKRKGIKRASIGVQCKRDRHVLSSLSSKVLPFSKTVNENLRLNLQTKNYKMLNNPVTKRELLEGLKYKKFIHIETYPNGGATVVHMFQDEIGTLTNEQMQELAQEYFKVRTRELML